MGTRDWLKPQIFLIFDSFNAFLRARLCGRVIQDFLLHSPLKDLFFYSNPTRSASDGSMSNRSYDPHFPPTQ